jgi:thioredoxin-related protein
MKFLHASRFLVLIMLFSFSLSAAETEEKLSEGMVNPGYHEKPSWFKESFLDIREDIEEAAAENKRVLLYFYQDGCPYCGKLLRDNFADREIAAYSQQKFDVIAINMWGDREVVDVKRSFPKTWKSNLRQPWYISMKPVKNCYASMAIMLLTVSLPH